MYNDKSNIERIFKALGVRNVGDVTTAMFSRFLTLKLKRDRIAPKTHNRYRGSLHAMFNWALERGYVKENPVSRIKRMRVPDRTIIFLNLEQIKEQLKTLTKYPKLQAMVATLIYAGVRRSELLWLTHEDVDLEDRMLYIRSKELSGEYWEAKTGKNRLIPISTALMTHLTAFRPSQDKPWFFPSPQGTRWDPDNFSHALRSVNKAQKLPWSCLHFRHTFGSQLAMKGESLYKISKLMGNSPEICMRHYAALVPSEMRDVVEFAS